MAVELRRDAATRRLVLIASTYDLCLHISLDSGLIHYYRRHGTVHVDEPAHGIGLQIAVMWQHMPVFIGRLAAGNPFLPAPRLGPVQQTADHITVSFVYDTVIPLSAGVPAATLRLTYDYNVHTGLRCVATATVSGHPNEPPPLLQLRLTSCGTEPVPWPQLALRQLTVGNHVQHAVTYEAATNEATLAIAWTGHPHTPAPSSQTTTTTMPPVLQHTADLLLHTFDADNRLLVGINIAEHHGYHYYGTDRDDIVAEMIAIACRYYIRFGDKRFLQYAQRLGDMLLDHLQPDGGLTFGMQVNGANVDYSDTDADAIDALLQLFSITGQTRYKQAALIILKFMLQYQDETGFFWGRYERQQNRLRFGGQPWFTAYASVAMMKMLPYVDDPAHVASHLYKAAHWLQRTQRNDGSWPHDETGPYADYDDLTNTAAAVWCLAALDRKQGTFKYAQAVESGLAYLAGLEHPQAAGHYAGRFIPGVEVLLYDYKLGFALREGVDYMRRRYGPDAVSTKQWRERYETYLAHIAHIQGRHGAIRGAWGSVYHIEQQRYLVSYAWHERHSSWQQYAFLGWQGKLVELFLQPYLDKNKNVPAVNPSAE